MQKFHFPLAHVRDFRVRQLEMEQAILEALHRERRALADEWSRLEEETAETRNALMVTVAADAQYLAASDLYLRHLEVVKKRHAARLADWQVRAAKQQQAVVEARRRVRLLEKLEERKRKEWQSAADREQENLASELYLAGWKR